MFHYYQNNHLLPIFSKQIKMRLNALKLCISVLSLIIAPHQLFASDLLSKTDAFTRLQSYFVGKDVDYYFINNGSVLRCKC